MCMVLLTMSFLSPFSIGGGTIFKNTSKVCKIKFENLGPIGTYSIIRSMLSRIINDPGERCASSNTLDNLLHFAPLVRVVKVIKVIRVIWVPHNH